MSPTVHLTEALSDGRTTIDCESVDLKGKVAWIDQGGIADMLVVPIQNLAGVEGGSAEQEVEHLPTQGGQYSEVVTRIS
jgi:hypothetical protein